jgi:hypothetical protein
MLQINTKKGHLDGHLWPILFDNTLIFSFKLFDKNGLFGIKNNMLRFMSDDLIAEEIVIEIPESIEEVMGYVATAEYLVQRVLLTPKLYIEGIDDISDEDLRTEVLRILNTILERYQKNKNLLDRVHNHWS